MGSNPGGLTALEEYAPQLRAWQSEALEVWKRGFRGTVAVVTGGGKTVFCFVCMREILKTSPNINFIIVVPTVALLDQWAFSLRHDVGLAEDVVCAVGSREVKVGKHRVLLCVINTARDLVATLTGTGHWFLCVDECHRAGSPENSRALSGIFTATLGLSATPERQYDLGFEEHVVPTLGPIIYSYTFTQALHDGVVAPFDLTNVRIPLLPSEKKKYQHLSRAIAREFEALRSAQGTSPRLERLLHQRASVVVSAKWRVPTAVALAKQFEKPTIIFHERIQAVAEIESLVQKAGRRAVVYHSGLSKGMRQRNLALFREGIADTLITCRSLDEGFNVPEAEIGILAASTRSFRQRVQRLGRVIRRSPGKDRATVCTLYATEAEEVSLRDEMTSLGEVASVTWYDASIAR